MLSPCSRSIVRHQLYAMKADLVFWPSAYGNFDIILDRLPRSFKPDNTLHCRVLWSAWWLCSSCAEWCLQSDAVTDSRLQVRRRAADPRICRALPLQHRPGRLGRHHRHHWPTRVRARPGAAGGVRRRARPRPCGGTEADIEPLLFGIGFPAMQPSARWSVCDQLCADGREGGGGMTMLAGTAGLTLALVLSLF